MKKRRALYLSLLALALLVCVASGLVMRGYWREQAGRELILAIKANDTNRALDALRAHADPNVRDEGKVTPSLRAYLLKLWQQMRGIKSAASGREACAVGLAVEHDNTIVVEALLARGAKAAREKCEEEVEIRDGGTHFISWDATADISLLEVAARHGDAAIVQALARHGCDVNEVNHEHATAIFFAGNAATVKVLVACGADLAAKDTSGRTALDYNIWSGDERAAEVLLENGAYDLAALRDAAQFRHIEPLRWMLRLGWQCDTRYEEGQTPLMNALQQPNDLNSEVALLLIRHGASVNIQDNAGETPLLIASSGGQYPQMFEQSPFVVRALLERGARINCPNNDGQTPLMVAATHLRPVLVRLLLQHGAQVNVRTQKDETALSLARHSEVDADEKASRSDVVRLLKNAGAKE